MLRLLYELTLGKEGYWYPYLRGMPDVVFTSTWSAEEVAMTEDDRFAQELEEYKEELEAEWRSFSLILKRNPDIFPEKYTSQALFNSCYAQVCTRCFGANNDGLSTTSMIPMADNLNHSSIAMTYGTMNVSLHQLGPQNSQYYRIN